MDSRAERPRIALTVDVCELETGVVLQVLASSDAEVRVGAVRVYSRPSRLAEKDLSYEVPEKP